MTASYTQPTSGLPAISRSILRGKRVDARRAGMTAIVFMRRLVSSFPLELASVESANVIAMPLFDTFEQRLLESNIGRDTPLHPALPKIPIPPARTSCGRRFKVAGDAGRIGPSNFQELEFPGSRRSLISFERGQWPPILPVKGGNLQKGMSRSRVISVKDNDVCIPLQQDRLAARSQPALVARQQRASSALQHRLSGLVEVWPSDARRTTHHGLVSALNPTAAQVEGNEKIIVIAMMNDEGCLNCLPVRRQTGRGETEDCRDASGWPGNTDAYLRPTAYRSCDPAFAS